MVLLHSASIVIYLCTKLAYCLVKAKRSHKHARKTEVYLSFYYITKFRTQSRGSKTIKQSLTVHIIPSCRGMVIDWGKSSSMSVLDL